MAGQGPSRFDYLFEPIDGDTESAGNGDIGVIDEASVATRPRRPWSWLVLVTATIVGVVIALIVLWSSPVDAVETPAGTTTQPPPAPVVTSSSVVAPAPASVVPPSPTPEPTVGVVPEPEPAARSAPPAAAPSTSTEPVVRPSTPTVRSPISVSPEPRPAFPNQKPPDGDQNRRGLLGLGGLL